MTAAAEPRLLVGELAERVGVDQKTIRYYGRVGPLEPAARSSSGYRLYRDPDADRQRLIRSVKRLGFSLGEIREILALRNRGRAPCSYVAERLELRTHEVERQMEELRQLKRELGQLRRRARTLAANHAATRRLLPHPRARTVKCPRARRAAGRLATAPIGTPSGRVRPVTRRSHNATRYGYAITSGVIVRGWWLKP